MALRATSLARIAAEAEGLRFRRRFRRYAFKAAWAVVTAVFVIAALIIGQLAAYLAIKPYVEEDVFAALIVMGVDVTFAIVFAVLAFSGGPDRIEREALEVRRRAQAQMGEALAAVALLRPIARIVPKRHMYGLMLATLTARYLSGVGERRR